MQLFIITPSDLPQPLISPPGLTRTWIPAQSGSVKVQATPRKVQLCKQKKAKVIGSQRPVLVLAKGYVSKHFWPTNHGIKPGKEWGWLG